MLKFILSLLFICSTALGDAVIFSGNDVKALKYNLDLFGRSKVMGLNVDPSAGAGVAAPLASLGMDYLTGEIYYKYGAGATQWRTISGAITGTPNTFAGYDAAGDLNPISQWTFTATGTTLADVSLTPSDAGGGNTFSIHRRNLTLAPTTPLVNDNYFLNTNIVTLNGSNAYANVLGNDTEIDKNGDADIDWILGNNIAINQRNTGTAGQITGQYTVITAGDGSNASTTNNLYGIQTDINLSALNTSTNVQGILLGINSAATAVVDDVNAFSLYGNFISNIDGFNGVSVTPQITGNANYYNGFYGNPEIAGTTTSFNGFGLNGFGAGSVTNFTGFYANPGVDITNFTGLSLGVNTTDVTSFLGVSISPNAGNVMTDFTGVGVFPQTAATNFQGIGIASGGNGTNFTGANIYSGDDFTNYTGVGIAPNGVMSDFKGVSITPSGGGTDAIMINASGSGTYSNSYTVINADASSAVVTPSVGNPTGRRFIFNGYGGAIQTGGSFTTVSSLPQLVDGGNVIFTQFNVESGSPISGTDFLGNNLSGALVADDDYSPSAFGLGWSAVGLVGQLSVASGKTVDKASFMIAGGSVPVTSAGGTIASFSLYDALGIVPAGGTLSITDMYGLRYTNALGFTPTNEWGVSVENTNADNYFSKNVVIGGSTKQPTNTSVGLEIAGTTKAILFPRMTTAQKNALTAVDGMQVYDTDLARFECYVAAWIACGASPSYPISLANGGTNKNMTASAGSVIYSDADSFEMTAVGTSGQFLQSAGAGTPVWADIPAQVKTVEAYSTDQTLTFDATKPNRVILVDASSGARTITLPAASGITIGYSFLFKKVDSTANEVTIEGDGGDTIDGDLNQVILFQYSTINLIGTDSSAWGQF